MSKLSYLEKLLAGAEVEWKSLGELASLRRGRVMSKGYFIDNIGEYPVYSSQTANNGKIGSIDTFDFDGEYISWTTDGANAGTVFYRTGKFSITNVCGLIKINNEATLNYKYLFYWLTIEAKKHVYSGMGNPKLMSHQVEKIPVPIPCPENPEKSLVIQSVIVRILDKFTALTTELTIELTARKKQYNYYCEQLLNFDGNIPVVQLSDCCVSISDGDHQAPPKTDSGVPFITISNVTNSNTIDFENTFFVADDYYQRINDKRRARKKDILYTVVGSIGIPVYIDFDMKFAFQRHIAILRTDEQKIIPKYLYHVMRSSAFFKKANSVAVGAAQKTITLSALNKMDVPIPPIGEQERIVNILDKFDTLANSLSEGLPREIELRQKQYEYYRDMLFSFPKPEVAEA
ncbi:restriction endonuclease subunit S [Cronobacter dublinensis subsp. infanticibi]|uniref:restriction endonuclease subunit S n=1 Tax=Cronobacter dublinensis TaxID=413497 RepID=UPI0023DD19CA|nr:restriction endonuclease subunit S [Cronobacter dublinensis]WEP44682.1 restriction endonuclease subunit S [Cronobacter dublinensis]